MPLPLEYSSFYDTNMRPRSPQLALVRFDPTTPRVMQTWSPSYLQALTSGLEIEPASSSNVRTSTTQEIEPESSSNVRTSTSTLEIELALSSNVETSSTSTQEPFVSTSTRNESSRRHVDNESERPHKPKLTVTMLTCVTIVEKGVCVICFEEWCEGNVVSELPCKHKFHFECVSKWLGIRAMCPLCRYGYDSDSDSDSDDDDYTSANSELE